MVEYNIPNQECDVELFVIINCCLLRKIFFFEFVFSYGCYKIYLLLNYQKHDYTFYIHHHRHSIFFLFINFHFFWLEFVQLILYSTDLDHFNRLKEMNNPFQDVFYDI